MRRRAVTRSACVFLSNAISEENRSLQAGRWHRGTYIHSYSSVKAMQGRFRPACLVARSSGGLARVQYGSLSSTVGCHQRWILWADTDWHGAPPPVARTVTQSSGATGRRLSWSMAMRRLHSVSANDGARRPVAGTQTRNFVSVSHALGRFKFDRWVSRSGMSRVAAWTARGPEPERRYVWFCSWDRCEHRGCTVSGAGTWRPRLEDDEALTGVFQPARRRRGRRAGWGLTTAGERYPGAGTGKIFPGDSVVRRAGVKASSVRRHAMLLD